MTTSIGHSDDNCTLASALPASPSPSLLRVKCQFPLYRHPTIIHHPPDRVSAKYAQSHYWKDLILSSEVNHLKCDVFVYKSCTANPLEIISCVPELL